MIYFFGSKCSYEKSVWMIACNPFFIIFWSGMEKRFLLFYQRSSMLSGVPCLVSGGISCFSGVLPVVSSATHTFSGEQN